MKILTAALICVLAPPAAAETLTGIAHPTDGDTWHLVMPEGSKPRRAAFKAVAGGVANDVKDFAALARQAAELDTFRGFLDSLNAKPALTTAKGGAS
jgi:hypothetical protein